MRSIVVSNTESLRTQYFIKAGQSLGVDTGFVYYQQLLDKPWLYNKAIIKLEPPQYEEADFAAYSRLNEAYIQLLYQLDHLSATYNLRFFNTPAAILRSLDKVRCKQMLYGKVRLTPMWEDIPPDFDALITQWRNIPQRDVFVKPRFGSGAGGVIALRQHPRNDSIIAYTSLQKDGDHIYNTNRINRLTRPDEIAPLVNAVFTSQAVIEDWVAKECFNGEAYDLRVVCQFGTVEHIVVRCSKSVITNLHLNNNAKAFETLPLNRNCTEDIRQQCIEATRLLGLAYAGVDVLIAKGTATPYIIEVNGQGDHIYQDLFGENRIYTHQLEKDLAVLAMNDKY